MGARSMLATIKKKVRKSPRKGGSGPRGLPTPHPGSMQRVHMSVGGGLADGAAATNAVAINRDVAIAGSVRGRFRFKSSVAGTLSFAFLRPKQDAVYAGVLPSANVAVVAATESTVDFPEFYGEAGMRITFTPSATGTITWADLALL